ncbi:hypothetical protein KLP40_14345 [Hymenobacter sp. NST-14]|uniref:hypothetical protein n=1 Tax=Hymenobacter piscis TaxID=2839984 RepID=UPI001C01E93B|nr:hypothetical protein [Hymenobacter piscis]MBT9394347.1 hypothetical protein [Hymenobacter piscis]
MLTYLPSDTSAENLLQVGHPYPYKRPLSLPAGEEGAIAYLPIEDSETLLQVVYFTPLPEEDKVSWATHDLNMVVYQGKQKLTHLVLQVEGMCCFDAIPRLPVERDEHLERWMTSEGCNVLLILVDTNTGRVSALREVTAGAEWAGALRAAVQKQMEELPAALLPLAVVEDSVLPLWQMMAASTIHLNSSPLQRPLPPLLRTSFN